MEADNCDEVAEAAEWIIDGGAVRVNVVEGTALFGWVDSSLVGEVVGSMRVMLAGDERDELS